MGKGVLDRIFVVDWTQYAAGPCVGLWLALLGAETIHVERRLIGDMIRGSVNPFDKPGKPTRGQAWYEWLNLNKRDIALDLGKEEGREIMYRLVDKADVFVTNYLPNVVDKYGMDYETLSKRNSRLVYGTNSINELKGPDSLAPGWDTLGQARSGMMALSGEAGSPPTVVGGAASDIVSGFSLFAGILSALLARERFGVGQRVDTSQLRAGMNVAMAAALAAHFIAGADNEQCRPPSRVGSPNPASLDYRCKDGKWIQLCAVNQKYWENLAVAIDRPELIEDSRFANLDKRAENSAELLCILEQVFAEKTLEEWQRKFREGGGIPFAPINRVEELASDPQVIANDVLFSFGHPVLGHLLFPGMPFVLSETPAAIRTVAPEIGQHNEEILLELGYTWEDIIRFHDAEVI